MLAVERHEFIKNKLLMNISVDFDELLEELHTSKATLYRDIIALQKEGFLSMNKGVITANFSSRANESSFAHPIPRQQSEINVLNSIAKAAMQLISSYDSIFIGEGYLCYLLALQILKHPDPRHLTVVTNNFNAAVVLYSHVGHLYLIGGELLYNAENLYTGGYRFAQNLSTILVNKAFAGVDGIDPDVGYTMKELSQLTILQQFPTFANEIIFLASSNKFGNRSIHHLAPMDFASHIITDNNLSDEARDCFSAFTNPKLIVAGEEV